MTDAKTLFTPIVEPDKLEPRYRLLIDGQGQEPARRMLDDVYQSFVDADGNFVEQFQTTGFDARFFELYLHAYFTRSGFALEPAQAVPDFVVSRGNVRVAVEATTVNPSTSGVLATQGRKIEDLADGDIRGYRDNELPIRFGSPLLSKVRKRYWELPHCQGIPLVIAVEAFHDQEATVFSSSSLERYLYGLEQSAAWSPDGAPTISTSPVDSHQIGAKRVPSGFFTQPDTEHISAIVFTNSGTHAKFTRMGYQTGYGCDTVDIQRVGYCYNPDPAAMDPSFFSYNLQCPPMVEPWGQGLVVIHNPRCLHPVPSDFFVDATQSTLEDGVPRHEQRGWQPFSSKTLIRYVAGAKQSWRSMMAPDTRALVHAISKQEFAGLSGMSGPGPFGTEHGWFADDTQSFIGVVLQDAIDGDWRFVVLAREKNHRFACIQTVGEFAERHQARGALQQEIFDRLMQPRRIF